MVQVFFRQLVEPDTKNGPVKIRPQISGVQQGRIQKIQKEGAESSSLPPPTPERKLHFSGHAAYSIVGVFVM